MAGYIGNKAVNLSTSGADISGTTNLDIVDIDGAVQIDATLSVGVDDTGYDVKFFGATASAYMLWDASADDLILGGAAGLSVNSASVFNGGFTANADSTITIDDNGVALNLVSTDTDASQGPVLRLTRDVAGAASDVIGTIQYYGKDVAGNNQQYVELQSEIVDATEGSEDSSFIIKTYAAGDIGDRLNILPTEAVFNEGSRDIDFRVESDAATHAFFVEGSTGNVGMSTSNPDTHTPQTHNPDKRSVVNYTAGGTHFVAGRSDTAVNAGDYIGGYLFKTNDTGGGNRFGGMTATADDTTGNGNLEFFPVATHYDSSTSAEGQMQLDDNGDLYLRSGGIRVGRSHGNVYTTSEESITIYHNGGGTGDTHTSMVSRDGTAGDHVFRHTVRGAVKSEIEENGDFLSATNSYGATSDGRLKENIAPASSQWNDIKALQFKNYSMIDAELDAPNMLGVIAQDLQAAGMNGLVKQHFKTNANDEPLLDADGNQEEYLSVKYSVLYMKAVKALQEAMAKIETLEARVTALEEV
jgi:hypothetical protein